MMKKIFPIIITLLLCSEMTWAGSRPQVRRIDYTGFDYVLTDCSSITIDGHSCWDSDDDQLYVGDGTTANLVGGTGDMAAATYDPASVSEQLVGLTAAQTLTNKTIDGDDNTLQDIAISQTKLVAGTNITLVTNTLSVDDAFLVNNADDSTTGTITAAGITVSDSGYVTYDPEPASDHSATGVVASLTTDQDANFGDVLFLGSDGNLSFADADASTSMPGVVMAIATINGDPTPAAGNMLIRGYARDDTWAWTVGGLIYVSTTATTGNTLTQTAPSGTGDQVQVVGYATHADRMYFDPSLVLVEI